MKKTVILILIILPIFLLITIAFAGKILSIYQHIPVERVQFVNVLNDEPTQPFELNMGEVKKANIRIFPELASNKKVTYTSSDENICTIDEDGDVYGLNYGSADITVTTHDGNKTDTWKVVVTAKQVLGITLPYETLTMTLGESTILKPTVELPVAENKAVTFISDNPAVVSIDASGKMTAKAPGKATITAAAVDNSHGNFAASCEVTVVMGMPALAFDFTNADFIEIINGIHVSSQAEFDLLSYVTFNPDLVKEEDIRFKIVSGENNGTCALNGSVLTLLKKGMARIMVYVGNDASNPTYQAEIRISLPLQ